MKLSDPQGPTPVRPNFAIAASVSWERFAAAV